MRRPILLTALTLAITATLELAPVAHAGRVSGALKSSGPYYVRPVRRSL